MLIKVQARWARIQLLDSRDGHGRRMLVNEFLSWRCKWARVISVPTVLEVDRGVDSSDAHADRALLQAEILQLPRRRRAVLALRYYGDLSDA